MNPGPPDSLFQKNSWAVLAVILLGWIALVGWSVHRYQPVPAKPASVPSNVFSADRAWTHLERLVGNNLPHPAGSKENERVAGVIEQHFRDLGFDVEIQTGIREIHPGAKDRMPGIDEVPVKNLIVTVPGERSSEEVLLLAVHHDSVPFGPGASDDGLSVAAAMEIGDMLSQFPPQHNVTILFSDGEELGLLGAKLFADRHPVLKRVGVVLNFDVRGTAGPTLMFETQGNTNRLIPALASRLRQAICILAVLRSLQTPSQRHRLFRVQESETTRAKLCLDWRRRQLSYACRQPGKRESGLPATSRRNNVGHLDHLRCHGFLGSTGWR